MARELSCPQCPQVLTIPDSLLGQSVRCPQCGGVFQSTADGALIPDATQPPPAPAPAPQEPPPPATTIPCPACGEQIPREAVRCPFCDEDARAPASAYEDGPGEYIRRDVTPHRANIILLLGILSLVSMVLVFCCPMLCVIGVGLGAASWMMANADLKKMSKGEMDPGGEGNTNAGKICGIIGLILCGLITLGCGAYLGAVLGWQLLQDMQNK